MTTPLGSAIVTADEAERMIGCFSQFVTERQPANGLSWRVRELRHNLSAYDATCAALAESLGARLLTTDARAARAPGRAWHSPAPEA